MSVALQFVIGRSGSGKTHYVYENLIKEACSQKNQEYFLIVPEQYTLQTQKDIVEKHPNHGTMNIDIVSFPRLAYRVFEELSYSTSTILEDMGKRMVLRKILEDKKEQWKVFGTSIQKPGFVEQVKSVVSELYQYQIKPEQLRSVNQEKSGNLNYKLHDLALICDYFQEFLEDHFIVAEQLLEELAKKVPESSKVKDSIIYIDGFTGFTPVQNQLLGVLLRTAKKVVITVTADHFIEQRKYVPEYDIFSMSYKTIQQLKTIANEAQIPVCNSILLKDKEPYRVRGKQDLAALEKGIFRYPVVSDSTTTSHITLSAAKDRLEEVRYVCEKIEYYVREKKFRYRDIGIITGDMESYSMHFEQCFAELGLPYFIDYNKSILNNSCVETIRGAYQIVEENFSYESVFRYLKAGMSSLNEEQADELENYVIAKGIRGKKRWTEPFDRLMSGQSAENLLRINESRSQFVEEILPFYTACKEKSNTVKDHMTLLYELLRKLEVEEKLEQWQEYFNERQEYVMEKTYEQIYPFVLNLMDKIVNILGSEVMPLSEVRKILDTGLEEMQIGVIPSELDQVVVGDLTRTRLNDIKVLFFVGMNEGAIPKSPDQGGIINDYEREILEKKGIHLSDTVIQSAYTEQFYLYLAFSKPSEHLYLSYATIADDGSSIRPSYVILRIQNVLPELKIKMISDDGTKSHFTEKYEIHRFISGLRMEAQGEENDLWKPLGTIMKESDEQLMELYLNASCYENKEAELSKDAAKIIYGTILKNSVSRLEQFESCAYAHFLKYGLRLQPREEFRIQSMDLGNIFHRAVELVSNKIQTSGMEWKDIDETKQTVLSEEAVEHAISEWNEELLNSSYRNQYVMDIMKRMTKRTLWALIEHLKKSDFKPYGFEISFSSNENLDSSNIVLDNDMKMQLLGKIDRVDRYEDENGIYLKVIDYKSGTTTFDLSKLYYGLQMQLVLYMNAIMEMEEKKANGKPVYPGGMFYYTMKDPFIKPDGETDPLEQILQELKMDGYVNKDHNIIEHMENDIPPSCISIPVKRTKTGYSVYSKVLDTNTFQNIQRYVDEKIRTAGNEIVNGKIDISPYRTKKRTACDYCNFREICHFDGRLDVYREFADIDKKELLKMWKGED